MAPTKKQLLLQVIAEEERRRKNKKATTPSDGSPGTSYRTADGTDVSIQKGQSYDLPDGTNVSIEHENPLTSAVMYPVRSAATGLGMMTDAGSGALDSLQDSSAYALNQILGSAGPTDMGGVNFGAAALPVARAYQAINPFTWGSKGEAAFDAHPEAVESLRDSMIQNSQMIPAPVRGMLPDVETQMAALQFVPQAMQAAGVGAPKAIGEGVRALTATSKGGVDTALNLLKAGAKGVGSGAAFGGVGALAGSDRNRRLEAIAQGATDPMNIALGVLPEVAGTAVGEWQMAKFREWAQAKQAQHDAVTFVGNPALDPVVQQARTQVHTPDPTVNNGRAGTVVDPVLQPRVSPLDPTYIPEPGTRQYKDGDIGVNTFYGKMTDAERMAYGSEKADQHGAEHDAKLASEPTQNTNIYPKMRRAALTEAEPTKLTPEGEATNPGRKNVPVKDPVEQLPSFTDEDVTKVEDTVIRGKQQTEILNPKDVEPGPQRKSLEQRQKWATQVQNPADMPTGQAFIADLYPPQGPSGLGETGMHKVLQHSAELNWARGLLDAAPEMQGVLSPGEMAGQETGPFKQDPTQMLDNGDVAKMGLGPGGSAFENGKVPKLYENARNLGVSEEHAQELDVLQRKMYQADARGDLASLERFRGEYNAKLQKYRAAPKLTPEQQVLENNRRIEELKAQLAASKAKNEPIPEKYAQALVDALNGKPEELTAISTKPRKQPVLIPMPEPRRMNLANAGDVDRANVNQVVAKQQTKRDPRVMQQPNKVPIVDLPPSVQPNAQMERDASWVERRLKQDAGYPAKVAKFASLPEQRAVPQVASAIRGWESGKRMQDVMMAKLFPKLRAALKEIGPEQRKLVEKYIAQNVSPERVLKEGQTFVGQEVMPSEFKSLFDAGMAQNRKYRDDLIAAGMFTKEQVARMEALEKAGFQWLHRDFMRFMDGQFVPRHDMLGRAIDWVAEHGGISKDAASAHVVDLLNADQSASPQQRWARSRLNKEILQGRQQIPSILRDLMGEVHNPAFVTAASMSEIERMWRQYKVSQTYTAPEYQGIVWDNKATPGMHETPIPLDKRMYGEFAGKYVSPELYESIMQAPAPKLQNAMARAFSWVSSMFKTGKVALSPITYVVNGLSNLTNMAAAGLPIWHPNTYSRFGQALKAFHSFNEAFTTNSKLPPKGQLPAFNDARWFQWMLEDGAHRPGLGAESAGSEAKAIAKRYLREAKGDYLDFLRDAWSAAGEGRAKMGAIYDMMDSVPRAMVYIEQVTQGVQKGLDLTTARARASRIVNENFVSAGNVGHGVRGVAQYTGLVNPFMTWHADNIRVHINWMRNAYLDLKGLAGMKTGRPGYEGFRGGSGAAQLMNVALQYGIIYGAFEGLRRLNGVTDQEIATADSMIKEGYRKYNPLLQYLPGRDEYGRPRVMNLSPIIPSSVFIRGTKANSDPGDLASRVFVNALSGFAQGGLGETTLNNSLAAFGIGEQDMNPQPILPGQEGWKGLQMTYNYFKPGIMQNAEDLARRTQIAQALAGSPFEPIIPDRAMVPGRYEEKWTPGQALWNTFPITGALKVQPLGFQGSEGERLRQQAVMGQAKKQISAVKKSGTTPTEQQRLRGTTRENVSKVRSGN